MEVSSRIESMVTVIDITGSIDGFTSGDLLNQLDELIQGGARDIVVDLCRVDFISSAGLRAILQAQKQLRLSDGDLRISNSQERVMKVLKLSGYTNIFKVFPDTLSAVASFAA